MNRQIVASAAILALIFVIGVLGLGKFGLALLALVALGAIGATIPGYIPTPVGVASVWAAGYMMSLQGAPKPSQTFVLLLGFAFFLAGVQAGNNAVSNMSYLAGTVVLLLLTGLFLGQKYSVRTNRFLESVNAPEDWKFSAPAMELKEGNWEIVTPNSKTGLPVAVKIRAKGSARIMYQWSSAGTTGHTLLKARVSEETLTGNFRTTSAGGVSGGSGQFQLDKAAPGCFRGAFRSNGRKAKVALRQAGNAHCQP